MNNIIYKIDRKTVKQLRKELEKTLNEFSKEHGIMVKLGNNVRFNDSEFRVKLTAHTYIGATERFDLE